MNDAGFASKLIDNNGPVVLVAFWNDQIFSGAIPQACEKDGSGCHSFKLFANLGKDTGVDQAWINAWNNSYYYVRAFKLQDGQLIFEWNVALLTGVTPDYIKLAAIAFKSAVDEFDQFQAAMKTFEPFPPGERISARRERRQSCCISAGRLAYARN